MKRKDRSERRNLNAEEAASLIFTDFQNRADEYGWPFPDYDDFDYNGPRDVGILRRTDTDVKKVNRGYQVFKRTPMM